MAGPSNHPEKNPEEVEQLKKIPKRTTPKIPRNSRKKCLACNDGLVKEGKQIRSCKACKGQGFIL